VLTHRGGGRKSKSTEEQGGMRGNGETNRKGERRVERNGLIKLTETQGGSDNELEKWKVSLFNVRLGREGRLEWGKSNPL